MALKKSLVGQDNNPNADVYQGILVDQGLDPATIPGQTFATRVFEAYKGYPAKRKAISEAVANLMQSPPEIIPGELDEGEIRAALKKSLERQNNDPDAVTTGKS